MTQELSDQEIQAVRRLIKLAWPQTPGFGPKTYVNAMLRPKIEMNMNELQRFFPNHEKVNSRGGEVDFNELDFKARQVDGVYSLTPELGEYQGDLDSIYNNQFRDLLQLIVSKLSRYWLIIKLAKVLEDRYAMSFGQAEALVLKIMGSPLSDTNRSQLYKLRNKIRKYRLLVENFGFLTNEDEISGRMSVIEELQTR